MEQINDQISTIQESLKKINEYTKLSGPCINSLFIKERNKHIEYLTNLQDDLNALLSRVEIMTREAKYYQDIDIRKMNRAFGAYCKVILPEPARISSPVVRPEITPWIDDIQIDGPISETVKMPEIGPKVAYFGPAPDGPHFIRAQTGPISAQIINGPGEIRADGQLYYIEGTRHFAIRLFGTIIHGNMGKIYRGDRAPQKIKGCKYAQKCTNPYCTYYHDPFICPSDDIRNYVYGGSGPIAGPIISAAGLIETMDGPESEEKWSQLNNLMMFGLLLLVARAARPSN